MKKKIFFLIITTVTIIILAFFFLKFLDKDKKNISTKNLNSKIKEEATQERSYNSNITEEATQERSYSSNIIENVRYSSNDPDGNEYIIIADQGEIDIKNSQIIFLKNVKATIKLKNSDNIKVSSDFGKYDTNTLDTVFSENVLIEYLENKIIAGYLDFSISRNSMIISKNVVFDNDTNILKTDVVEIDLKTKDTKFYMYDKDNKVSLIKNN